MDLKRLLQPRRIAVLGGVWADTVTEQALALGFDGDLWRVHPKRGDYQSLSDLPEAPDAVFLGVNAAASPDLVAEARSIGAGGVVAFASGFSELGSELGLSRQAALSKAAGDMPVMGPNCYGMINFLDRAALFPDQVRRESPERGVAVITQSGTVALNVMYADRSLPLGYLLATGNAADVTLADLIRATAADPRTTAIGLYIESIPDLPAFTQAVQDAGKPVVVFKAGRSVAAQRTTQSHTGALGGQDRYFDAYFERLGVARVDNLAQFMETLKVFHGWGRMRGNQICAAAPSGGDVAMAADVLDTLPLELPPLPKALEAPLVELLGDTIALANPLDFQTQTWHDPEVLEKVFATLLRAPVDAVVLQLDFPSPEEFDASSFMGPIRAFFKAAQASNTPAAVLSSMPENLPRTVRQEAWEAGVVPLQGMAEGYAALGFASRQPQEAPSTLKPQTQRAKPLNEWEGKAVLHKAGIPIPKSTLCKASDVCLLTKTEFPVVAKACDATLIHKSDLGGVKLNIQDLGALKEAAKDLSRLSADILIEDMVQDSLVELILGVDQDPQFGPVVLIGAGGVFAEILEDSAVLLPPFSREMARNSLLSLKTAPLLKGYRGAAQADIEALVDVMMAVQSLAPGLSALDINPLIVRETGAVALDCYMTLLEPET
ncbi:MAG: acetate--CoA ligase family protein [Pseudomonadota bacterium]